MAAAAAGGLTVEQAGLARGVILCWPSCVMEIGSQKWDNPTNRDKEQGGNQSRVGHELNGKKCFETMATATLIDKGSIDGFLGSGDPCHAARQGGHLPPESLQEKQ